MASPLEQVSGGSPAEGMVPGASGGNPMLADMFKNMLAQGEKKQGYLEQQQAAYNKDMEKYATMVTQSQQPESNEAAMWGSMAGAASSVAPTWGNLGAMIGKTGEAYGNFSAKEQAQNLQSQGDLTKLRQAEVRALESKDQSMAMARALTPKGVPIHWSKNSDGTTTAFDNITGAPIGTYGPQDIAKITALTSTLAKGAMDKGEYATLDEATAWATKEAMKQVAAINASVGNRTTPLAGEVGGLPTTQKPGTVPAAPSVIEGGVKGTGAGEAQFKIDVSNLRPEDKEVVNRLIKRYEANPNEGTMRQTAQMISQLLSDGSIKQVPGADAPMVKKDLPKLAEKTKSSEKSAEMYAESFKTNVLDPMTAFGDTAKIMNDFNQIGALQGALKNGKLKEFMAGESGKWALSFLPEESDLRKGIANAQEAEKLTAGMINKILLAAKGVQTEGDAQRARSQVTSVGTDPEANKYLAAYTQETARQLKLREQAGRAHKDKTGSWAGYDDAWQATPLMKEAKGSVKRLGDQYIGVSQYIDKFIAKNPTATESDAVASWNKVKS